MLSGEERDTLDIRYRHYDVISCLDILTFKLKGDCQERAIVPPRVLQTGGNLMFEVSDRQISDHCDNSLTWTPLLNTRLSFVSATLSARPWMWVFPLKEGLALASIAISKK